MRATITIPILLATASVTAQAGPFKVTDQQRYISIGASVSIVNAGGEPGGSGSAGDSYRVPRDDFSAMNREVGLDGGPLGTVGYAGGRAVQRSSMSSDEISFYGFGDIFVQLVGSGDVITGGGGTSSGFSATFTVTAPTSVSLALGSMPSMVGNDFQFGLSRANGQMVWGLSSIEQPDGPPLYSFERRLELSPGVYNVGAFVGANYSIDGIGDPRAEGQFILTAVVPEPSTYLLWCAGISGVAALRWKRTTRARS